MALRIARKAELLPFACRAIARAGLAVVGLVIASEQLQNAVANGDTRSLALYHTHTKEDVTVTFKRNGRYDDEGLRKLDHFLRDWRNGEQTRMDPRLFDIVWEVHREMRASQPVNIISAYRSPQTNAMLRRRGRGVARQSQHMVGKAIDFFIPGVPLEEVRIAGLRLQRGGVGYYPTSGSPFVHLDTGSVRHWPRLTPVEMARAFPNGQTVMARADAAAGEDIGAPGGKSKRNLFARLFGFSGDEDEDLAEASSSNRNAAAVAVRQASSEPVPIPRARPTIVAAAMAPRAPAPPQPAGFTLASASSTPVPAPAGRVAEQAQSANDVIASRGLWAQPVGAPAVAQAVEPGPARPAPTTAGTNGPRLVWVAGPSGRPVERADAVRSRSAAPKPETTAGITRWPIAERDEGRDDGRMDRVPAEIALAYAATAAPDSGLPRATPMGTPRPAWQPPQRGAESQSVKAVPPTPAPKSQAKVGSRYDDPWLRGVMVAPSVHYSMSVANFGPPDYRHLRTHMHKPRAVVAMVFSADPHFGMTSETFDGSAVSFVPVISFGTTTAWLR